MQQQSHFQQEDDTVTERCSFGSFVEIVINHLSGTANVRVISLFNLVIHIDSIPIAKWLWRSSSYRAEIVTFATRSTVEWATANIYYRGVRAAGTMWKCRQGLTGLCPLYTVKFHLKQKDLQEFSVSDQLNMCSRTLSIVERMAGKDEKYFARTEAQDTEHSNTSGSILNNRRCTSKSKEYVVMAWLKYQCINYCVAAITVFEVAPFCNLQKCPNGAYS